MWKSLAFTSRYGHQRLPDMMALDATDRHHYMQALAGLIKEESKSGDGGMSNSMATGGG